MEPTLFLEELAKCSPNSAENRERDKVCSPVIEHSDTVVEHSDTVVEHSGTVVEHSGTVVEHSGTVVEHSGTVVEHSGTVVDHSGTVEAPHYTGSVADPSGGSFVVKEGPIRAEPDWAQIFASVDDVSAVAPKSGKEVEVVDIATTISRGNKIKETLKSIKQNSGSPDDDEEQRITLQ